MATIELVVKGNLNGHVCVHVDCLLVLLRFHIGLSRSISVRF